MFILPLYPTRSALCTVFVHRGIPACRDIAPSRLVIPVCTTVDCVPAVRVCCSLIPSVTLFHFRSVLTLCVISDLCVYSNSVWVLEPVCSLLVVCVTPKLVQECVIQLLSVFVMSCYSKFTTSTRPAVMSPAFRTELTRLSVTMFLLYMGRSLMAISAWDGL